MHVDESNKYSERQFHPERPMIKNTKQTHKSPICEAQHYYTELINARQNVCTFREKMFRTAIFLCIVAEFHASAESDANCANWVR